MKKSLSMKQSSTLFLKFVIFLIGAVVLAGLLVFPHFEGRNDNADLIHIYFQDPFLAYIYISSIPFFIGLYQGFNLLGYIDKNIAFSELSVKALRTIKYCAFIICIMLAGAMKWIFAFAHDDDAPGVVLIGIVIIFASFVVGTFAAVLQKLLQNAAELKSENDLTV